MDTIHPKIRTIDGKWPRFVIVQESPEPDARPQYWDGKGWVGELRAALLYADKKFVREDLKQLRERE